MGAQGHDLPLLDELARFYNAYSARFTTLGELRSQTGARTELLRNQGSDSARTLAWVEPLSTGSRVRECTLCNSQFFHPVAWLIRVIAALPDSERTQSMMSFARLYGPLVVRDHLIRLLYEAEWDFWGARDMPKHLVDTWKHIITSSSAPKVSYQHAMRDLDLWLVATAAEMLGANAVSPQLVPLSADESTRLRAAVETGVALLQKKRTFYPDTKNFAGQTVGSVSYFNGDFADHEDNAYSGYDGQAFPSEQDKRVYPGVSWDVSHAYRIPVCFWSLYQNRKAAGVEFPSGQEMTLLTNQYVYKVFQGDFDHPLFNNYFNGCNGWVRVAYHGGGFGIPPAQYCDQHNAKRPCLTVGAVQGWGLLAAFNPDLMKLEQALAALASKDDPETRQFKDRYYWYAGKSYSPRDAQGKPQYPFLLFLVLSEVPQQ
jgi:hypothetical protein